MHPIHFLHGLLRVGQMRVVEVDTRMSQSQILAPQSRLLYLIRNRMQKMGLQDGSLEGKKIGLLARKHKRWRCYIKK
jgi:hypothetical protein